jgi:hypothetical protein
LDEYQEPLSAEQFEQQQENFEEGKYNMNVLSLLNTISYCILILYAYKDFLATVILYIYTLGCILVSCASAALSHLSVLFKLNLINGYMQLDPKSGPLCCVLERLTSLKRCF